MYWRVKENKGKKGNERDLPTNHLARRLIGIASRANAGWLIERLGRLLLLGVVGGGGEGESAR